MQGVFLSGIAVLALRVPLRGELAKAVREDAAVRRRPSARHPARARLGFT